MRTVALPVLAGALLLARTAAAQAPASVVLPPERTLNVKASLFPLVAAGYHVSVEKVWGPAYRHALMVTPQLYRGTVSDLTSELSAGGHDRVRGYGLEVQHRIYLSERIMPLEGFYVAYGPSYQHFQLQFQGNSWASEAAPDGLTYYQYRLRDQTETIDRYGASAVLGGQFFLPATPVFFDVFIGLGFRKARSRATLPGRHYASGMSDYGSDGQYVPIGFRVGLAW